MALAVSKRRLNILQVNHLDVAGGAETIARLLHRGFSQHGHSSTFAVGQKRSGDPDIVRIPDEKYRSAWARACLGIARPLDPLRKTVRGADRFFRTIGGPVAEPLRYRNKARGEEDFDFPSTRRLLELTKTKPDILQLHNLHGGYFDLRALPELSAQLPVFLTLHDAWLFSGHCAHSLECERWRTGCGMCPDLDLYPSIPRDATAFNWKRKARIFRETRLRIVTPSRWLMQRAEESILFPAMVEGRVIPNGIDLSIFQPGSREKARQALGIPMNSRVLLFTAAEAGGNRYKDYPTLKAAVDRVTGMSKELNVVFLVLGEDREGNTPALRFVPFQSNASDVVRYYQASDIYLHASRADTFPTTVLEAMACGVPVVATAVGGIPEQVSHGVEGFLVPPGDSAAMSEAILTLLRDDAMRRSAGIQAAERARSEFGSERMMRSYLDWYAEVLAQSGPG